ncbi:hypothetical protein C453_04054 [Haloferax elongans ATCC BAA-1513]|uniref:Small CPxCG-related zinc finger protein n=1 Tax=Haloferax elongans ATCC BAA-1513 TaxID=1230453 RepID=M0HSE1_HALEO|nr:hypothetical protein [Haloferax elongans]ELZ87495.1 hypothetical protein C453_04054 [Haloferax elongans ATCC BAA-1513]
MSGGTYEPQSATDQQCSHCGLYFRAQGIHNHESSCYLQDHDTMIQPLDDPVSVREAESPTQDDPEGVEVADTQPTVEAVTDGGNPALDAPDPVEKDDGGTESDEPACPDCGSDRYGVVDEHRRVLPTWAHEYDYICADCREVYNV